MKNSLVLFACLLVTLFAVSCKKEQPVYSCNPDLNKWILKNQARYSEYGRSDLADIRSLDSQSAIYASLSPESKYDVWMEKFQLVLNSMTLSEAERTHIQTAMDYFDESFWQSNESLDQFSTWMDAWGAAAIQDLGWDSSKLFIIAGTWLMPSEMQALADHYLNNEKVARPNGAADPPCECRYSVACQWFQEECAKGGCSSTYTCGLAGTSRCKGLCVSNTAITTGPDGEPTLIPNSPTYVH